MANPAELLHDLFVRWNKKGSTAKTVRNDEDLREHRQAVRYLESIDELLKIAEARGKRVSAYRSYFPHWVKTVFRYPHGWELSGSGEIHIEQIRHLDTLVDIIGDFVQEADPDKFEDLSAYLKLVETALTEDTSLPLSVLAPARAALANLRGCIDAYEVVGAFDFAKGVERLLGALAMVAISSNEKARWRKLINAFVVPYAVNNLPGLAAGAGLVQLMLGSGS